ncbi:hypothetical protein FRB96_008826 [Tulasnella sp. 330]|nr:hypothetical protein FRB96_008826 [Tulasnella sp. 330]
MRGTICYRRGATARRSSVLASSPNFASTSFASQSPLSSKAQPDWKASHTGQRRPSSDRKESRPTLTSNQSQAVSVMYNFLFPNSTPRPKAGHTEQQATRPQTSFFDEFAKRAEAHNEQLQKAQTATMKTILAKKRADIDGLQDDQQLIRWTADLFARQEEIESLKRLPSFPQRADRDDITAELEAYSHIIGSLMSTFRDRYRDPHLALAVFDHVRHRSVASYVCGCKTPAYHQLLITLWTCFKDLRGVANALREMKVNGVEPDTRIRELAQKIIESPLGKMMTESASGDLYEIDRLAKRAQA